MPFLPNGTWQDPRCPGVPVPNPAKNPLYKKIYGPTGWANNPEVMEAYNDYKASEWAQNVGDSTKSIEDFWTLTTTGLMQMFLSCTVWTNPGGVVFNPPSTGNAPLNPNPNPFPTPITSTVKA